MNSYISLALAAERDLSEVIELLAGAFSEPAHL